MRNSPWQIGVLASAALCLCAAPAARACEALLGSEYTDPPEIAEVRIDQREWHVAFRQRTRDYALREYVLATDAVQNQRELVTWQVSFGSRGGSLAEQRDRLLQSLSSACGTLQQRSVPAPAHELRFEWWHADCGGRPQQHELVRLVEGEIGTHSLTYVRTGAPIPDVERTRWWDRLSASPLVLAAREGATPALHAGRVALWRGDYAVAQQKLEPLARQGLAAAQVSLAGLYAEGWGVARDYAHALQLLQSAASQQDPEAALRLGRMYENGWGVPRNVRTAVAWYARAAAAGNAEAAAQAGVASVLGEADLYDVAGATRFFALGATRGNTAATYWLGFAHEHSWSVARDPVRAADLYRQAAIAGDPNAQLRLALAYEHGMGVKPDRDEARKWHLRAALQGIELSQLALRDRFGPPR